MRRQTSARAYAGTDLLSAPLDWSRVIVRAAEIVWTRSLGAEAVAAASTGRLTELARFARSRSPFYRAAWRSLPRRDLSLDALPVVTKGDLMAHFDDWATERTVTRDAVDEFVSDKRRIGERFLDRFVVWKSSGSTGEPGSAGARSQSVPGCGIPESGRPAPRTMRKICVFLSPRRSPQF